MYPSRNTEEVPAEIPEGIPGEISKIQAESIKKSSEIPEGFPRETSEAILVGIPNITSMNP